MHEIERDEAAAELALAILKLPRAPDLTASKPTTGIEGYRHPDSMCSLDSTDAPAPASTLRS
jgi:hypothetical protein